MTEKQIILSEFRLNFFNADLTTAELSPFAPEAVAFRAARLMLDSIKEQVQGKHSFAIESTFDSRTYARMIPEWRAV